MYMYAVQDFGHKSASAIRCASLACLSLGLSSRSTGIATRDFDVHTLALLLSFYLSGSGFCLSTFFPIRPFGFHPSLFLPFSYSTFCLSPIAKEATGAGGEEEERGSDDCREVRRRDAGGDNPDDPSHANRWTIITQSGSLFSLPFSLGDQGVREQRESGLHLG